MANNQIALLAQTPVFDTPFESQGKALQLRSLMNQGQAQDMDMQQKRQTMEDERQTRDISSRFSDPVQRIAELYKVNPKAAMAMQTFQQGADKSAADIGKTKADTSKIQHDSAMKQYEAFGQAIGSLKQVPGGATPQHVTMAVQRMVDLGVIDAGAAQKLVADVPQDPRQIAAWLDQGQASVMSAKDQLAQTSPDANARLSAKTSTDNSIRTTEQAERGSVRAAGTAAAGRAQSERHFGVTQSAGKVPAGYRANADGSMSFIPGGPADPASGGGKAPTEFQGKSASFGARAEESDRILTALEKGGVKNTGIIKSTLVGAGEMVPFMGDKVGAAIGSGMNALPGFMGGPNGEQQQVEQARRDFVNAVLRQESGAAIGPSEFENAARQYFPQPGDKDSVVAQKAKNRKLAIQGFMNSAGKAAFHAQQDAPETPALPSGWTVKAH